MENFTFCVAQKTLSLLHYYHIYDFSFEKKAKQNKEKDAKTNEKMYQKKFDNVVVFKECLCESRTSRVS